MKNVHLIPTEKPSVLRVGDNGNFVFGLAKTYIQSRSDCFTNQHIYITSDEEIKERDWVIAIEGIWKNTITKITGTPITDVWRKIILTTDYDLIAEGVQAIDDEFLWWFSENPSCESVEIENKKVLVGWEPDYTYEDLGIDGSKNVYHNFYKIIIPQEEPKQETIEEAAKKLYPITGEYFDKEFYMVKRLAFIEGAKWQSERMYSEEDLHNAFYNGWLYRGENYSFPKAKKEWFKQFKKK
jgi:hypothetical protein